MDNYSDADSGLGKISSSDSDIVNDTFTSHDFTEHHTTGTAGVLDSDSSTSIVSHLGNADTTTDSWDLPDIGPSHGEVHTIIDDTITDAATLGGNITHNPVQNGSGHTIASSWWAYSDTPDDAASLGTATSHSNPESSTLSPYASAAVFDDPYTGFETTLDDRVSSSPVNTLFDHPPGPVNHWDAWWSNPNTYFTIAKWIVNPVGQAAATALDIGAMALESASELAYDLGNTDAGYFLADAGIVTQFVSGLANPQAAEIGMLQNSFNYGLAFSDKTGSTIDGILAGVGKYYGVIDAAEFFTGTDTLTGQQLTPLEQNARGVIGIASFTLNAIVPAMQAMDLDACLFNGCFVAGTQVVLGVVEEDASAEAGHVAQINLTGDGALLTLTHKYLTQNIELLRKDDLVLSRHELRPCDNNVLRRVEEVFVRQVFELQIVTLRSSTGALQTIRTTAAHPVYIWGLGWMAVRDICPGDQILEPGETFATVVEARRENYPDGILVYNFRVEGTHTYFVREAGSTAEPLWVHNVRCGEGEESPGLSSLAEFDFKNGGTSDDQAGDEESAPDRELTPLLDRYLSESGGRWGGTETRALNDELATQLENEGFTVTGGAGRDSEEWIPGPGGGTEGGTFVDITATKGNKTVRIQTVSTLADGTTLTPEEAAAADRIRAAFPKDELRIVPKR